MQSDSDNNPLPDSSAKSSAKRGWKNIASTFGILLIAPILAIFITVFVFQSYEVYGMSMETTLQNGDRLIVQKLSKNWSAIRGREYVPQRGEIVVFSKPSSLSSLSGDVDHLIKRVIGLPGERVVVRDGKYTIYNAEHPDGFDPDKDQEYAKDILTTPGEVDITVGESEIFVSGDNRTNSLDSRNFGAINVASVTGIATIRFVPVNNFKKL
jgi:signal peptidase I